MKIVVLKNKHKVDEVVEVHMKSFTGFFLTFLGKGFLRQLYKGFVLHPRSDLIVAVNKENQIVGFLAYSEDLSGFYKFLVRRFLLPFAWYAGVAFIRKPQIMFRLFRAFRYSNEAKRKENYIELSSIGVCPEMEGQGIGSRMIEKLKKKADVGKCEYIKLETDADNNENANAFYKKNAFVLDHIYETKEGRKMNEYRYYLNRFSCN